MPGARIGDWLVITSVTAGPIVSVNAREAVWPAGSATCTVKLDVCAVVGVPESEVD